MRKPTSHKGDNGRVLVIGGCEDFVGAPVLAGMAALRSGCDIAVIATHEWGAYAINSLTPDLITKKLKGTYLQTVHVPVLLKLAKEFDCVVIGPGLGEKEETQTAVRMLCEKITVPKIIDADALRAKPKLKNCIVTPHAKEFEVLFGKKPTKANAKKFAKKNAIVLLKGPTDFISDGTKLVENKTGNASMTKGGTGDCLAGLVAGLVAQGMSLFDASVAGAWINGRAGEIMFGETGYGYMASELLLALPEAILEYRG